MVDVQVISTKAETVLADQDSLPWSASAILSLISFMDSTFHMNEWDGLAVAVVSLLVLQFVFHVLNTKYEVGWYALIHACVVGTGSLACSYLDRYSTIIMGGGSPHPLRLILCDGAGGGGGALTSLHRVLPFVTLGFAFTDVMEGLQLRRADYLFHGTLLGATFGTVCYLELQHCVVPMLLMELSSVPLNLRQATFLSSNGQVACSVMFALSFFVVRILIVPYIWGEFLWVLYQQQRSTIQSLNSVEAETTVNAQKESCFPPNFAYVVFVLGVCFHALNFFWMIKIGKKIQRKLSGKVTMAETNKDD